MQGPHGISRPAPCPKTSPSAPKTRPKEPKSETKPTWHPPYPVTSPPGPTASPGPQWVNPLCFQLLPAPHAGKKLLKTPGVGVGGVVSTPRGPLPTREWVWAAMMGVTAVNPPSPPFLSPSTRLLGCGGVRTRVGRAQGGRVESAFLLLLLLTTPPLPFPYRLLNLIPPPLLFPPSLPPSPSAASAAGSPPRRHIKRRPRGPLTT